MPTDPSETWPPLEGTPDGRLTSVPSVKLSVASVMLWRKLVRPTRYTSLRRYLAGKDSSIHCPSVPVDTHSCAALPKPRNETPPVLPSTAPEGGDLAIDDDALTVTPARRAMLTVEATVAVGSEGALVDEALAVDEDDGTADDERVRVTMPDEEAAREEEDEAGREADAELEIVELADEKALELRSEALRVEVEEGRADEVDDAVQDACDDDELRDELVADAEFEAEDPLREADADKEDDIVGRATDDELEADRVALPLARVEFKEADCMLEALDTTKDDALVEALVDAVAEGDADAVELASEVELPPEDNALAVADAGATLVEFLDDEALALMLTLVKFAESESVLDTLDAEADAVLERLPLIDEAEVAELEPLIVLDGSKLELMLLVALGRLLDMLKLTDGAAVDDAL